MKKFLLVIFSLCLGGIVQPVMADNRSYLSLGIQGGRWDVTGNNYQGIGWGLDGGVPVSDSLSLVGAYSRMTYDPDSSGVSDADFTEWQLGSRWQTDLSTSTRFGLQYRYVDMVLSAGGSEADEYGHRGQVDLGINMASAGLGKLPSLLNLSAGQTAYESEDRWFFETGLRSFINRNFSLGLHYRNEAEDRHLLTLSIREDR